MKHIGFIKEHDQGITNAIPFGKVINSSNPPNDNIKKVISYLNKGIFLAGATGSFYNIHTKEPIIDIEYFTDGEWIWPAYFSYYLKKYPNFPIDQDFINYLSDKNFIFHVSDDLPNLLEQYEEDFLKLW